MKSKILSFALLTVFGFQAQAVPLFGETAGTIKQGVLTLYKDHDNPKKVYFFPNSTKFSVDNSNVPLFNFVYWGLGSNSAEPNTAGAYMTMSTHLASDPDQAAALTRFMAENPQIEVAVLPVKSSIIGLQTTSGSAPTAMPLKALFTEFNFAKTGGRAEDEIGINAVLTPVGARAFKALLTGDKAGSLIKFDYCYTIQGYGPNMDATVKVNMRRVYDYFEAKASFGWFWNVLTIREVIEKLSDTRDVVIKMNGGDATQWEVLNKIAQQVTARLFVPELAASPVPVASANNFFRFNVGGVNKTELKEETWTLIRRDLENREFCTAVVVKDLQPHLDKLVTNAD